MADTFTLQNEAFSAFLFYGTLVLLKTVIMSVATALNRIAKGVYANKEDCESFKVARTITDDPVVERIRRNHLNDLENVLPFILLGLLYLFTNPATSTAVWHFRVFAISRFLHTVCYQAALPQPSRALAFFAGFIVNMSLGIRVLLTVGL